MPWMALLPDSHAVPRPCSGRLPARQLTLPRSAGRPWGCATPEATRGRPALCAQPCLSCQRRHPKPLPENSNFEVCPDQEQVSCCWLTYGKTHRKLRGPSVWGSEVGGGQAAGDPSCMVSAEKASKFRLNEARCLNGERIRLSMQEMQDVRVQFPGLEYSLEKEMATHSSILAWEILWTEESSGLPSMGSQKV